MRTRAVQITCRMSNNSAATRPAHHLCGTRKWYIWRSLLSCVKPPILTRCETIGWVNLSVTADSRIGIAERRRLPPALAWVVRSLSEAHAAAAAEEMLEEGLSFGAPPADSACVHAFMAVVAHKLGHVT